MPRVLISDKMELPGLEILRNAGIELDERPGLKGEELKAALRLADGVVVRSGTRITADLIENPGKLRVIVRGGVGVDNIDVAAATRKGIVVMNTPDANTFSTAEHTISLLMSMARHVPAADASMRAGKWEKSKFLGCQLTGKTLGVLGLGRIGREVARRAANGLDMKVVGYDPVLAPAAAAQLGIESFASVDEILPKCDFITVHTPLTEQTKDMIGAKQVALLPKGARVINCARGGIINEQAVIDGINSGHLAGAAFDVFVEEPITPDHAFLKMPNVVITPHLGAATAEAQLLVAKESAQLLVDFLCKGMVRFAVNMGAMDRAEMEEMRPFVDLAHRLGLMAAQLNKGSIQRAEILYRGEIAKRSTRLVTSAFAAGLLERGMEQQVNIVNARMLASERGVEVVEQASMEKGDFSSLIKVSIQSDKETITIAGTLFGNQYLRLVQFGSHRLDAHMDGVLLIFTHKDVPGLIGHIGTICGKNGVNIAQMNVGRQNQGGEAIAVLNLDARPPESVLKEVSSHPQIRAVTVLDLPPAGELPTWFA